VGSNVFSGTIVAGFRLEWVIGEGALGVVYLAEDTAVGRRVALKLLSPELARDERFRRRFLRESRIAGGLDHPNAVSVVESGEHDGLLYLAMDYVEGSDLRELLRREGRLEPGRALNFAAQVAEALDAAHAAGLVHRDVKPGNILVTAGPGREQACVCDFGLARHVSSVGSLTGDRGFVGTIDYVPPEQIEGAPLDARADVYSLGCVLFECLAGERPFDRDSELSVVFAHLNEPPPLLSDLRPELPEAFDTVFATALAKSPDDRYATCRELVEAARAALRGQTVSRGKRRRLMPAAAVVVAAAGLSIGGTLVWESTHGATAAISETAISGATLGLDANAYEEHFGKPWSRSLLESGHLKLTFTRPKVGVYFKGLTDTAVEMTTWNKAYRTAEGVGPCSTIGQVKRAYGSRLKPSSHNTIAGETYAYTVDRRLIFAFNGPPPNPSKRVTAVALYYGDAPGANKNGGSLSYAGFIALTEKSCS
jgi:tRNA A-37 threonylcarbamoyl transferase component Bud32